ncbi:MAG TPA: DinB family protein [Terriglobales bacterium]
MNKLALVVILCTAFSAFAQQPDKAPATMKSLLLQQLHETHNQKNWFVSAKEATAGETAEQSTWTDGKGNHSVGQLIYHLAFWNGEVVAQLKDPTFKGFNGNNDDTFNKYEAKNWDSTVKKFDDDMTQLEKIVESADDAKIAKIAPVITRVCAHNAYHIGEIVMVRKEQGTWNPENGVK